MSTNPAPILDHLAALVGFDTQNPPRNLDRDSAIWDYLATALGDGFTVDITDHGKGRMSFLAVRGSPGLLFNVHLDTVPVIEGSLHPPLQLTVDGDRAYGRGACDIKGAAACLLHLAQTRDEPLALLFSTDEEGAEGCCIDEFIAAGRVAPFSQVVVAEPTACRAETRHRGYVSVKGRFTGVPGHSSEPRTLRENAIHRLSQWAAAALRDLAAAGDGEARSCFNIGTVSGGVKSNVIAGRADIHWSARLPAGRDNESFITHLCSLEGAEHAEWHVPFSGPPLPNNPGGEEAARSFAERLGLELGKGLDFWTEASLFAASGTPALVLGPGHIAQAHAVDEWVEIEQLQRAFEIYQKMVTADA